MNVETTVVTNLLDEVSNLDRHCMDPFSRISHLSLPLSSLKELCRFRKHETARPNVSLDSLCWCSDLQPILITHSVRHRYVWQLVHNGHCAGIHELQGTGVIRLLELILPR